MTTGTLHLAPGRTPARPTARESTPGVAPVVIAHRGASGYRPEHTLASYLMAIRLGADYIEPDLVSTADGHLIARHENEISGTTDIAGHQQLAGRRTTKVVDGRPVTGWFTEDLTLAEVKQLRAVERLPQVRPGNTRFNGLFEVPTFEEILDLVQRESRRLGRPIGVYPETKHPTYFDGLGLSLEEPLVAALRRHRLDSGGPRVMIQSFETGNLQRLGRMTPVPLVQLIDASGAPYDLVVAGDPRSYDDLVSVRGLAEVARYASAIGTHKDRVLPRDPVTGAAGRPSSLVDDAHRAGLLVHLWTLRDENRFMATNFRRGSDPDATGDSCSEARAFLDAGVDGIFSDHSDSAVAALEAWLAEQDASA